MGWNHLPVAGGIYDQHPKLLEGFETIFRKKGEHERREADKKQRSGNTGGRSRR
jgi:hypothetical protein